MIESIGALLLMALLGEPGSTAKKAMEETLRLSQGPHKFYLVFAIHRSDVWEDWSAQARQNVDLQVDLVWSDLRKALSRAEAGFFSGEWQASIELLPGWHIDPHGIGDPADERYWFAAILRAYPHHGMGREGLLRWIQRLTNQAFYNPSIAIDGTHLIVGVKVPNESGSPVFTKEDEALLVSKRLLGLLPGRGQFQAPLEFGDVPPDLMDTDFLWKEKWALLLKGRTEGL